MIVVEQTCAIVDKALANIGELKEWLVNDWIFLVSCDPETHIQKLYSKGEWKAVELPVELKTPTASRSEDIFLGQTGTLPVHKLIRSAS